MKYALALALSAFCILGPGVAFAGDDSRSKDYDSTGYGGRGNDNESHQMRELEKQEAADRASSTASGDRTSSGGRSNGGWQDAGASRDAH